jgi:hypothetical protein
MFAMSNERPAPAPTPLLRTRPATMLTAIGLCVILMLIQFAPGMQDRVSRHASPLASTQLR